MSRKTRKLIWSAPLVTVLAVAGVLAMFVALEPGSVFANPLPGVPMNVGAEAASGVAGRTTLVVTWDAVADATGYRIDASDDSFVWETLVTKDDSHTMTTYTDNTLTADDTRWYRVFAVNDHGEGSVSDPAEGITSIKGKPGPVRNFRATTMGQRQINLTWDPPSDNGGEEISGYEIQYHNTAEWLGLLATGATLDNSLVVKEEDRMKNGGYQDKDTEEFSLDPGETRRYQIRAVNNVDPTIGVTVDDRTDEDAPGTTDGWVRAQATTVVATGPTPPSGLTAVNTGNVDGNIALYWFAPELENNGGWPVTDYLIQVRRTGADWLDIPDAAALAALEDTGKTAGDITAAGANFKVQVSDTYTHIQKSFMAVPTTWDHDGDATNDERELWLQFRVFAISTDDGVDDAPADDDNMLIIGRSASDTSVSVRAVLRPLTDADGDDPDGDGNNAAGETATAVTDAYGPPILLATGATNPDQRPSPNGDAMEEEIQLAIQRPTGVGTQNIYRLDYSDDDGNTWNILTPRTTFTGFEGNRRFQDQNIGHDADRTYRAFTLKSNWRTTAGPVSETVTGMTTVSEAPGKVTGVMASAPDLKTIDASWTAADDGGQPIVMYLYQYVRDDGDDVPDANDWLASNINGPVVNGMTDDDAEMASITATLMDQEMYHFRVAAVNKDGGDNNRPMAGPTDNTNAPKWSDGVSFTTGEAVAPNMVEGIASEAAKDSTGPITERGVDVLWNEPSAGADVDHYVIERSMDMGTTWESPTDDAEESSNQKTAYTDPRHYVAGETLVYRVAAANDAGMSDWVKVYYLRNPADDHMHPPTTAALTEPTGVTATSDTDSALTVMWMGGDNADRYIIIALERGSSPVVIGYTRAASGASEATITGLNSDMSHLVIVLALKGTGDDRELEYGTDTVTVQ